jgi:uncharacterized membrane protein
MKKAYALTVSILLIALGSWLIAIGMMHGRFSQEQYRSLVSLTLMGGFAAILVSGLFFSRLTAKDYRVVFTTAMVLLSLGLLMFGVFFGFMDMMAGPEAYGILLLVFLACYGLAMIMNGVANYILSQRVYRLYVLDLARSLPHIYRRYRL